MECLLLNAIFVEYCLAPFLFVIHVHVHICVWRMQANIKSRYFGISHVLI